MVLKDSETWSGNMRRFFLSRRGGIYIRGRGIGEGRCTAAGMALHDGTRNVSVACFHLSPLYSAPPPLSPPVLCLRCDEEKHLTVAHVVRGQAGPRERIERTASSLLSVPN